MSDRSGGGVWGAPQTYLVGERGPELLVMGSRGGVLIPTWTAATAFDGLVDEPTILDTPNDPSEDDVLDDLTPDVKSDPVPEEAE